MHRTRIAITVITLAAGTALGPVSSNADEATAEKEASGLVSFHLRAADGYRFEFNGANLPRADQARVTFSKANQSVTYEQTGGAEVTDRSVRARFQGLGRLRVDFRPTKKGERCAKGPVKVAFRGDIDVNAEGSLSLIDSTRARGKFQSLGCNFGAAPRLARTPMDASSATSQDQLEVLSTCETGTNYEATSFGGVVEHNATRVERGSKLTVYRVAYLKTDGSTFEISADRKTAAVSPTAPFSGEASFAAGQLTGDLTVAFLGLDQPTPLTPTAAATGTGNSSPCP